ncbi:MAG TPA: hypothetical protein VHG29_05245 [Novosphingobium sp.]|nr:hypothetical protein [Novosphingobium sp.]
MTTGPFLKRHLTLLLATLRDGLALFRLAPLIPLIAIIPEFLQHIAEIKLGMFASRAAFAALAMDPVRWGWGYLKIAGLVLGLLAAARFWGAREQGERWWDLRKLPWGMVLAAIALNVIAGLPMLLLDGRIDARALQALNVVVTIATLPLLVYLVAALLGDRTMTLALVYRSGWWAALRIALLVAISFVPLQLLHGFDHRLAFGQPPMLVWLLMAWDALVVGAMAALMGTALHHGYRGASDPA